MPLDSSFLRTAHPVEFPDPMQIYGQYMSLRDMMDRRKVRELELRRTALQAEQQQQEYQEAQNLRRLFQGPAEPTEREILAASPKFGIPLLRERRQADTAAIQQRTAQMEFTGKQKSQMADDIFAVLSLPEDQQQEAYKQLNEVDYVNRGWRKPGDPYPAMPTREQAKSIAIQGWGAAKWEELENKRAAEKRAQEEETRKALMFGPQYAKAQADNEAAQQRVLGLEPEQPHQKAMREAQERPNTPDEWIAWRSQPGRTPEQTAMADKIIAALTEYHKAIRPNIVQDTGTLVDSIMKQPAIYQGLSAEEKARVAPQLTARGFTQFEKPTDLGEYRKKLQGMKTLESAINAYAAELEQTGPTFAPEKGAKLKALYTNLAMMAKGDTLFQLGVLTGPDLQVLQGALTDPTSIRGNWMVGKKGLQSQIDIMREATKRSKNFLNETYGQPVETQSPAGAAPNEKKSDPEGIRQWLKQ